MALTLEYDTLLRDCKIDHHIKYNAFYLSWKSRKHTLSEEQGSNRTENNKLMEGNTNIHVIAMATYTHRMPEWLRLAGISGGHLVQPCALSRDIYSRLPRWLSSISREGDARVSVDNLCQCSNIHMVK